MGEITVRVVSTATYLALVNNSVVVAVNDDEPDLPIVSITTNIESIVEGAVDVRSKVQFTVSADKAPVSEFTATWTTSIEVGDTATAGTDFTNVANGSVTIAAGQTTGTFEVEIIGDDIPEENETFTCDFIKSKYRSKNFSRKGVYTSYD